MITYVTRRLLLMVLTLFGISIAVFGLTQMVPGGPVEQAIANYRKAAAMSGRGGVNTQLSKEELANIKAYFGFDKPIHVRYAKWMGNMLFRLDFGRSSSYRKPVWDVISSKFPVSIFFGLVSLVLTYAVSIPLGMAKALRHGSWFDTVTSVLTSIGYVLPGYALGVVLIVFFAGGAYLKWFPIGGVVDEGWDQFPLGWKILDFLHHMVLPLICYMVGNFAVLTLLMKNSLLEEMNKDYMRTALAKGQDKKTVVRKHVFRNSIIPLITGIGGIFTIMFTGSVLIERVFDIDGMGQLLWDSVIARDYNVVIGQIMIVSLLTLLGRLFSDLMYVVVDPRIRLE